MKYCDRPFTLVIDGHWWVRSRAAVCTPQGQGVPNFVDNPKGDHATLWSKMSTDLAYELRNLGTSVEHVIFVTDYKAWRKEYQYINQPGQELEKLTTDYKAGRTYDEAVDWPALYRCYQDWLDHLKSHFNVDNYKVEGAEGDDAIWYLSRLLPAHGRNMLYYSADKDLVQCMHIDAETGAFATYYNRKMGNKYNHYKAVNIIYENDKISTALNMLSNGNRKQDVFSISSVANANPFTKLLSEVAIRELERPMNFVFYRIVLGDPGDGIPPLMDAGEGKKPRWPQIKHIYGLLHDTFGITDEHPIKRSLLFDETFITSFVLKFHKIHMKADPKSDKWLEYYINRFKENRHLGFLCKEEIPEVVQNRLKMSIDNEQVTRTDGTGLSVIHKLYDANNIHNAANTIDPNSYFKQFEDQIIKQIDPVKE